MASKSNEYCMINSPFKWVGGKSRLRKYIIPLLPEHTCYVEPFAGAAWVLFGKSPSDVEILNDRDEELVNFFRVVKHKPTELIDSFEWELVSRAEFNRLADTDPRELTDVQRAHRFYYIIMAGWGGELAYPRFQTSISDGGHGNRLIGALETLRQRLKPVHARLHSVLIENLDWLDCINRYDRLGTVMYIDPPYPANKVNYFHNMRSWEDHRKLAERLGAAQCKWILSSYDTSEIRTLFEPFNCHNVLIQAASGMNVTNPNRRRRKPSNEDIDNSTNTKRVVNKEILIMNFLPPLQVHQELSDTGANQSRLEL